MLDIESLYRGKEILDNGDGTFICPVCEKSYKRKKSAQNHLEKQDCHSALDVFGNTEYEKLAMELYTNILNETGKSSARVTLQSFRKSRFYKQVNMFLISCIIHEVDAGLMFSFLKDIIKFTRTNVILSKGQEKYWIDELRLFIHCNPDVSDSKQYYEVYKDELLSNPDMLINAIEKAKISIGFVSHRKSLEKAVEDLPVGYRLRVLDILDNMGECKWA